MSSLVLGFDDSFIKYGGSWLWESSGKLVLKSIETVHKMCTKLTLLYLCKNRFYSTVFIPNLATTTTHPHPQFVIYITGSCKSFSALPHSFHTTNNKSKVKKKDY